VIVNRSQFSQSRELVYDFDGSVRAFARAVEDIDQNKLVKLVHAPFGWAVLPFTAQVEAFYVGVAPNGIPLGSIGWVRIAGSVSGILLTTDAIGKSVVEVADGGIRFSEAPYITRYGFGYIKEVDERGMAKIDLVPREIINDLGAND
jgi:hypothetical protein